MKSAEVSAAMEAMGRPDVLLETMLPGLRARSTRANSSRFGRVFDDGLAIQSPSPTPEVVFEVAAVTSSAAPA